MMRKLKDKNAPKRPLSSFLLFGNHLRETKPEIKNLPIKDQAIAIGHEWKDASEELKNKFNQQAAKNKEEYTIKRQEYEKTDDYKNYKQSVKEATKEPKKKRGTPKLTGYRLFISEITDKTSDDEKDPELAGKGHMVRCGIKWSRLSEEEK